MGHAALDWADRSFVLRSSNCWQLIYHLHTVHLFMHAVSPRVYEHRVKEREGECCDLLLAEVSYLDGYPCSLVSYIAAAKFKRKKK